MIKEVIEKYLPYVVQDYTEKKLGDRKTYVGASDVGGCERKAVLSKLVSQSKKNIEDEIKMFKGNLAESLLELIFSKTHYKWATQFEVTHPLKTFIKAHVDFLFYNEEKTEFGVLEMKTTGKIPDEPYENWILQVQLQMGLLKLQYPKAKIRGAVVVFDLNTGKMAEFNNLTPDENIFNALVQKAERINKLVIENKPDDAIPEESFLCSFCAFKKSCPSFNRDNNIPEFVKTKAMEYLDLQAQAKEIKTKADQIKSEIIDLVGTEYKKAEDGIKIIVKSSERKSFDIKRLQEEMPDVYANYHKTFNSIYFKVM